MSTGAEDERHQSEHLDVRLDDRPLHESFQTTGTRKSTLPLKCMYFLISGSWGAWYPLALPYFESLGLSSSQLGLLGAVMPGAGLVGSPIWAAAADLLRARKLLMLAALLVAGVVRVGGLAFLPLFFHTEKAAGIDGDGGAPKPRAPFALVFVVYCACELIGSGVGSFEDATTLSALGPARHGEFGQQRLWAAVSWGSSAMVAGLAAYLAHTLSMAFVLHAAFTVVAVGVLARLLPPTAEDDWSGARALWYKLTGRASSSDKKYAPSTQDIEATDLLVNGTDDVRAESPGFEVASAAATPASGDSEPAPLPPRGMDFARDVVTTLFHPRHLPFWIAMLIAGAGFGTMNAFANILIKHLGGSSITYGLATVAETSSELPIFFFAEEILERTTIHGAILISLVAYCMRMFWYWYFTNPWAMVVGAVLHGITFALLWSAGVAHTASIAREHFRTTAQGLLWSIFGGAGGILGSTLAGLAVDRFGLQTMFFGFGWILMAATLAYAVYFVILRIFEARTTESRAAQVEMQPLALDEDDGARLGAQKTSL